MNQSENPRRFIVREIKDGPTISPNVYDTAKSGDRAYRGKALPMWDEVPELYTEQEARDELRRIAGAMFNEDCNARYIGDDDFEDMNTEWDEANDEEREELEYPGRIEWEGKGYYHIGGAALYIDGDDFATDGDCTRIYVLEVAPKPHAHTEGCYTLVQS